jgi:O-antigen ligase
MLFFVWGIRRIQLIPFEVYYALFLAYSILSVYRSPNGSFAMVKAMLISFCFAVCAVKLLYGVIGNIDETVDFIGYWMIKGSVFIILFCMIYERPFYAGTERLGTTVFEGYGSRMFLTYTLTLSMLFLLKKIMTGKAVKWNYLELVIVFSGMALSGTRKLLLIFVIFIVTYYWVENRKRALKIIKFLAVGGFSLFVLYYLFTNVDFLYNSFWVRFQMLFDFLETGQGDSSASVRFQMIEDAFHTFMSHKLFGVGTDGFKALFSYEGVRLYSHNNFVELLCNLGLTGFLLFYIPYFSSIGKLAKSIKLKTKYGSFFFAALLSILISEFFTITYYQVPFLLFYELAALYAKHGVESCQTETTYSVKPVKHSEESCYE